MTKEKPTEEEEVEAPVVVDHLAVAKAQAVTPEAPAMSVIAHALIAIAERLPANTTNVVQRIEHHIVDDDRGKFRKA